MEKQKGKGARGANPETGILELTDVDSLPEKTIQAQWWSAFKFRYTTGPFLLPQDSGSLDWILLNNDVDQQKARVTVFRCGIGTVKSPMPPGPLVVTIDPGETTHNANEYTEGFAYEVQVECNSRLVFPYVSVWPGNFGVVMPGTGINSGTFLRRMPRR